MKNCEFLSGNICSAFKSRWVDHRVEIATHVPKFCVTDGRCGGNEFDPQWRVDGRCLAVNNIEDQQQCDDFQPKRSLDAHHTFDSAPPKTQTGQLY